MGQHEGNILLHGAQNCNDPAFPINHHDQKLLSWLSCVDPHVALSYVHGPVETNVSAVLSEKCSLRL